MEQYKLEMVDGKDEELKVKNDPQHLDKKRLVEQPESDLTVDHIPEEELKLDIKGEKNKKSTRDESISD
ncbi:hypothetical protein [Priestia koreensis]|uniref:hypothetical protein n=1 Tax=Priestia koreensis TaxID=284581 RepID=UPI003459F0B8